MAVAAPLRARGVSVTRGPLVVLDGIDLTVADGDTIGLIGPNGVGKTTLLRTLAGLDRAGPRRRRAHAADGHRRVPPAGAAPG